MITILIVILILILVNGFFAMSEMALVSVKPRDLYKLKSQNVKNADVLEKVTKDSTKYLSTIQVAITFAGFLSSAFAGSELSVYLVNFMNDLNVNMSNGLAVVIITFVLSFLTLVFGELVPKRIALSGSVRFALIAAPIISTVMKMFTPFVWLLTVSTKGVLKLIGINPELKDDTLTEQDIKEMIVYGHIKGLYQADEKDMIQRIFTFDDLTVDLVMTPKNEVVGLEMTEYDKKDYNTIFESQYSRLPVFKGDSIEGIVLIKDILAQLKHTKIEDVDVMSLIRKPYIVNRVTKINTVLKKMREKSHHLAFIVDDQNRFLGIVTLEDIVEEIIGNIYDEHDKVDLAITMLNKSTYIIDGNMLITDINKKIGINLPVKHKNIVELLRFTSEKDLSVGDEFVISGVKVIVTDLEDDIQLKVIV